MRKTWRQLHGIESRSDERRRRYAWGERRRRHAYRTRKHMRLERTHTDHGLLHWRNLCERSSCGSHRYDLLLFRLLQLRSAVLSEFLWQFKHLPYTSPLW